jgi:hypothetical protein
VTCVDTDGRKIDEIANADREGGKGGAEEIGIRWEGKGKVLAALSTPNWKERVQQCRAIWGGSSSRACKRLTRCADVLESCGVQSARGGRLRR